VAHRRPRMWWKRAPRRWAGEPTSRNSYGTGWRRTRRWKLQSTRCFWTYWVSRRRRRCTNFWEDPRDSRCACWQRRWTDRGGVDGPAQSGRQAGLQGFFGADSGARCAVAHAGIRGRRAWADRRNAQRRRFRIGFRAGCSGDIDTGGRGIAGYGAGAKPPDVAGGTDHGFDGGRAGAHRR
jgi:hypothetical protein